MIDGPKENANDPSASGVPASRAPLPENSVQAKPAESVTPETSQVEKGKAAPSQEQPSPEQEKVANKVENQVTISGTSGPVRFVGQQSETKNIFMGADSTFSAKTFSSSMTVKLTRSTEETEVARHVHDELTISRFVSILRETRILVISAEPDSGKGSTAIYLAHRLRQSDSEIQQDITQVSSLNTDVRINLMEAVQQEERFSNCVVFFKDFLARQNRTLREFLEGLDQRLANSLCRELEGRGAYLVFTADHHFLAPLTSQLQALRLCVQLPPLSATKLSQGLDSALDELRKGTKLTPEQREQILSYGKTIPRIRRFVRDDLSTVLEGKSTVEQAFARMDQVSLWLKDLAEDFEPWSVAFVLGLVQSVSGWEGVPWTEFQELYGALLKPIRKWTGTPEKYFSYRPERLCDDELLMKSRVTIEPNPVMGRDMVRFQDQAFLQTLWPAFIHQTRRLMTFLLPALRELAEGEDLHLRIHAARILGRIGEIDPVAITLPAISSWARSDSSRWRQATVGYLFQGVISSKKETYVNTCLAILEKMGHSDNQNEVWSAIAAYKQIGVLNLPLALDKLRGIAETKLAAQLAHTHEILRTLHRIEREFEEREYTRNETVQLIVAYEFLKELGLAIMEDQVPILFAMQYAIVALCLGAGPVQVFLELRKWLRGNEGLRGLVCLLYLESGGIADELSRWETEPGEGTITSQKRVLSNPVVIALASDPDARCRFAEFLEDIFANFNTVFPLPGARYLREAFFNRLRSWVEGATEFPKGLKALEDVFVKLITSPITELRTQTLDMLRTDAAFLKEGSRGKEFALVVMKRGLRETPGRGSQRNALSAGTRQ